MSQPDQQPAASSARGAEPYDPVTLVAGDQGLNGRSASEPDAMRKSAVVFRDVRTNFAPETVLDGVSFEVVDREFVCLLGASGCGKSTTLRNAGNLLTSYTGTVRVAGLEPARAWPKVAYVFQSPRLVPWRTALSNGMLGMELRARRLGRREIRRRALEALALVGLEKDADKYPAILSGGERQRVSVARALAVDPDVILMDEPFAALDAMTKNHMRDEVIRIWDETRKAIMFVTHDVDEALHLADKLVVFSNKPTSVLEEFTFTLPRPRSVEADPELRLVKRRLDRWGSVDRTLYLVRNRLWHLVAPDRVHPSPRDLGCRPRSRHHKESR